MANIEGTKAEGGIPMGGVSVDANRLIEKAQGCWNCVSFRQGEEVAKEWEPEVQRALMQAKLSGCMLAPEFGSDADAVLLVSALMQEQGWPQERAIVELERRKEAKAQALVGDGVDPWEFDKRVRDKRAISTGIRFGAIGMCCGGGVDPKGNPVGKFLQAAYECHKWTGRVGAAEARDGRPLDMLPGEQMERAEEKASK
jgi:hypothetical protein